MPLPPGPDVHPTLQLARWIRTPLSVLDDASAQYGDTFTLRMLYIPTAVVSADPAFIRDVFALDGDTAWAGPVNEILRPFLGDHSLLVLDGDAHKRHRKLMMPAFHGERMEAYGNDMLSITDAVADALPMGKVFPVHGPLQDITLAVILRTIFGVDDPSLLDGFHDVLRKLLAAGTSPGLLLPFVQRDLGPWSPWGRFRALLAKADDTLLDQIARRRTLGTHGRTDVLSQLIDARDEAGQPMTDAELRDELVTLLVAGHETTATTLAWAFHLLAEEPAILARLRAEIATAFEGGVLSAARVARLELLDAVVRETLRLQPVIPMVGRQLRRDARIGAWDLPAGTFVLPSIYLAQRRPATFPRPRSFEPDRFLRQRPAGWEWLPFGGGIRRCVGMAFALYEAKMVLAVLLHRLAFERAPGTRVRVVRRSITLTPAGGMPLVVTRRGPRVTPTGAGAAASA